MTRKYFFWRKIVLKCLRESRSCEFCSGKSHYAGHKNDSGNTCGKDGRERKAYERSSLLFPRDEQDKNDEIKYKKDAYHYRYVVICQNAKCECNAVEFPFAFRYELLKSKYDEWGKSDGIEPHYVPVICSHEP